nr:ANTAR domain-containing protein [Kibdelosporangium sp. MJ126-NF4]CEL13943.1 hypothetical protein [Kibdelosporangium sp. MJ126-NF4]CTQ88312.1 hypothetical protein [Kibdelosporangium sp. MJ126-NF4]
MSRTNDVVGVTTDETAQLYQEIYGLRAALRSRPLIARALGVIQGRYGLDADRAFDLLRESAQRHNLKLSTLASTVLVAAPPTGAAWFPGRVRRPSPSLSYIDDKHHNRTAVLSAFLDAVLTIMDTQVGDLQLTDPLTGALHLEQHRNLSAGFVDFFANVSDDPTSCATAMRRRSRVIVRDVATDPIFTGTDSGAMVLSEGVRSVQSTPVQLPGGRCVAMVSTHHGEPDLSPTRAQLDRVDRFATQTAHWLDWHQRTVVLDALEFVHKQALRLQ